MARILHLADLHLDTAFAAKTRAVRQALRSATFQALTAAVDDAIDENVDAVLLAGDVFDNERLRLSTENVLIGQMNRLRDASIRVIYATGNHDPGGRHFRVHDMTFPDNVTVVRSGVPTTIDIVTRDGSPMRVVAAGHENVQECRNLCLTFPVSDRRVPHIGLLHTMVHSHNADGVHGNYAPCTVEDLRRTGYDYWALGHIHNPREVDGIANAWYAGCLQGRHFRESGPRGGLLVDVSIGGIVKVEPRAYAPVQWTTVELTGLADVRSAAGLDQRMADALRQATRQRPEDRTAMRVILSGPCGVWSELRDADQIERLTERWFDQHDLLHLEIDASQVYAPVSLQQFRTEPTVLAEVLAIIDKLSESDPDAATLWDRVSENLERSQSGDLSEYRSRLVVGLEHQAVEAMVRPSELSLE